MAVIDETAFVMLICGLWGFGLYAAYLRFSVVRRLRRRIDQVVDHRLAVCATQASADPADPGALTQVNRRLAVLERIVTDGGIHTAAQIEALRSHDREPELTR